MILADGGAPEVDSPEHPPEMAEFGVRVEAVKRAPGRLPRRRSPFWRSAAAGSVGGGYAEVGSPITAPFGPACSRGRCRNRRQSDVLVFPAGDDAAYDFSGFVRPFGRRCQEFFSVLTREAQWCTSLGAHLQGFNPAQGDECPDRQPNSTNRTGGLELTVLSIKPAITVSQLGQRDARRSAVRETRRSRTLRLIRC